MLTDKHGRVINYLRLAVTDRCNLRCFYCMPESGLEWLSRKELMTYEEMLRISSLLVKMGIHKIRITGGEPFVRKDLMSFLHLLSGLKELEEITITTNGVLTAPLVPELKKLGIRTVNLSLDTLDRKRFINITYRDEIDAVMETLQQLLYYGIKVKLNAVVMDGKNTEDIIPLATLAKDLPVSVRFIEEMPFNGKDEVAKPLIWDHIRILDTLKEYFPSIIKIPDPPYSSSYNYHVKGHKGNIGIIAAYSRSFCGSCNRIRLTPVGMLKTCLYDGGGLNVKEMMRSGEPDSILRSAIIQSIRGKSKDGWEAEKKRPSAAFQSMAEIGG